jgi:excisionase family DNA binding protein
MPTDLLSPPAPTVARLLMSEREAAQAMGVTARTMYSLRHTAALPHVRIGARILYRPGDLAAWIEQRTERQTGGAR